MKLTILKLLKMTLKFSTYGFLFQVFFMSILMANNGNAQYKNTNEIIIKEAVTGHTVKEVFKLIEANSDFEIFYIQRDLKSKKEIHLKPESGRSVYDILIEISKQTGLKFRQVNNVISATPISTEELNGDMKRVEVLADVDISGKVTDENGEGLPGASVVVKDTAIGTTTDLDGNYKLNAPEQSILTVSFVGYKTQEITIGSQSVIDVQMEVDAAQLNEIVVVGYGTKDRRTLAGAVQTVSAEAFETRPVTNALSALQGIAPGLTVTQGTAQPGNEGFNLRVRGASSAAGIGLNNNSASSGTIGGTVGPLVLVDGIQSSMATLNPNDIESISILKDGSAAIYGNQAANGVILVTTKKGRKGAPKVTYDFSYASNTPTSEIVKLNTLEFMQISNEARANDGDPIYWGQNFFDAVGTDQVLNFAEWELGGGIRADSWLTFNNPENELVNAVFEKGIRQNHNLGISGGGDNSNYYFSLGYLNEDGVINTKFDTYKRYNVRLNYTFNVTNKIKLSTQNSLEIGDRSLNTELGSALSQIESNIPFIPFRRPDGEYYRFRGYANPMALLDGGSEESYLANRIISNYQIDYDIIDGLKLTANAGINNRDIRVSTPRATIDEFNTYSPELGGSGNGGYANGGTDPGSTVFRNFPNSLTETFERQTYINYSGYLTYNKILADVHNIEITGGFSHEQRKDNWVSSFVSSFATNDLFALGLGDQDNARVNQNINTWTIRGLFGRLNYSFNDKYIAEANIRRDQSSRFDPNNRSGVFAGYLFAWRASEESFIKDLDIFDNLKFRVSYGETGNQNGIGLYDYLALVNNTNGSPIIFGTATGNENAAENPDCAICGTQQENAFYTEAQVVSLDRTWETVATTNFGLDVGMLNRKLNFSFDYFIKRNKNMLVPITLPTVLGAAPPTLNIGELETKGWEFQVDWKDNIGEFNYYVGAAVFDNQNKLVNLNGGSNRRLGLNNYVEGYALGTYFGYQMDGIIQNPEQLDSYKERFPNGGTPNLNSGAPGALAIGDIMYADLDGNGQLSALGDPAVGDTGDLVELGNINPRYSYNIKLGGDYKGFDFRLLFQGVGKRAVFKSGTFSSPLNNGAWYYPGLKYYSGRTWTPENTEAQFPALSVRKNNYNYLTSENNKLSGAYIRLKNLQIGYSLPTVVLDKIGVTKLRIYVSGENLWEGHSIDKSLNFDPEAGVASLSYPFVRTYAIGAQVSF